MKNLEEIKDELAQEKGFKDWGSDLHEQFICGKVAYIFMRKLHDEVARRYAHQALDLAADRAMINVSTAYTQSRQVETKSFRKQTDSYPNFGVKTIWIDEDSILNIKKEI